LFLRFGVVLLCLSALLAARPVLAQECSDSSNQSQLNECADRALIKTKAAVKAVYDEIIGRLKDDPEGRERLAAARKAWDAYSNAECDFSTGDTVNGSMHPMLVLECHDELGKQRLEKLKAYLQCEEGDLTCPVPAN
jgi:uncharacterized protein YecT (DUF1311 family)